VVAAVALRACIAIGAALSAAAPLIRPAAGMLTGAAHRLIIAGMASGGAGVATAIVSAATDNAPAGAATHADNAAAGETTPAGVTGVTAGVTAPAGIASRVAATLVG
jgi:hypothetical protein